MSDATDDAEGQWAEHVAEMAVRYDGTDGLFGKTWAELVEMTPNQVIATALEETPEEQRAGFRGQMISVSGAASVIAHARKQVAARTPPKIVRASKEPTEALATFIGQELERWGFDVRDHSGHRLDVYLGEGLLVTVDVRNPRPA